MNKLKILQNKFIESVYDEICPDVFELVVEGKIPKEKLLDIYRNNLCSKLTNALRITYPAIYHLVGVKKFKKFCQEFIKLNRSSSGNLDDYGKGFANFFIKKEDEFLSNLAKLEWLKHISYLAQDVKPLKIEALQKLSEEEIFNIKFKLNPSCFLLNSNYNLLVKKKQKRRLKRQIYFVIYRRYLVVEVKKISKGEFNFLKDTESGLSLYQIYEKHKIDIQVYLSKNIANGVLSEFLLDLD